MSGLTLMMGNLLRFFEVFPPEFWDQRGLILCEDKNDKLLFGGFFGSGVAWQLGQLHGFFGLIFKRYLVYGLCEIYILVNFCQIEFEHLLRMFLLV